MKLVTIALFMTALLAGSSLGQRPTNQPGFAGFINSVFSGFTRAVFRTTTVTNTFTLTETYTSTKTMTVTASATVMISSSPVETESTSSSSSSVAATSSFTVSIHPNGTTSSDLDKKKIEPTSVLDTAKSSSSKPIVLVSATKAATPSLITLPKTGTSNSTSSAGSKNTSRFFSLGRSVLDDETHPTGILPVESSVTHAASVIPYIIKRSIDIESSFASSKASSSAAPDVQFPVTANLIVLN